MAIRKCRRKPGDPALGNTCGARKKPGKSTATYLDYVLTRITVIGAIYITLVCVIPEWWIASTGLNMMFLGGTTLLIVVNVTVDTITQIQSHMLAHQYGDLIKKAKLKGRVR